MNELEELINQDESLVPSPSSGIVAAFDEHLDRAAQSHKIMAEGADVAKRLGVRQSDGSIKLEIE